MTFADQLQQLGHTGQTSTAQGGPTYTLTADQLAHAIDEAFATGKLYVLEAIGNAGYAPEKTQRILDHVDHGGAALNDILQKYLMSTPELQKTMQELRIIQE